MLVIFKKDKFLLAISCFIFYKNTQAGALGQIYGKAAKSSKSLQKYPLALYILFAPRKKVVKYFILVCFLLHCFSTKQSPDSLLHNCEMGTMVSSPISPVLFILYTFHAQHCRSIVHSTPTSYSLALSQI